jgi:hypothetical protein
MTTLAEGRQQLLHEYETSDDPAFGQRMIAQVWAITTGSNPYFASQILTPEERCCYGTLEQHPEGMELCLKQWFETGASKRWGEGYE